MKSSETDFTEGNEDNEEVETEIRTPKSERNRNKLIGESRQNHGSKIQTPGRKLIVRGAESRQDSGP
jgi:hypothetical protein